jgi:hypothetical protein
MGRWLMAAVAGLGMAWYLCGCANFIRGYEDTEDRMERKTIGTKYDVQYVPDPPVSSAFPVTALRVEKQQVKKYQVFVHGELVTPYEGWRKAYEIPCGLILAPVSLCSQLLSVFSFGIYPFSVSSGIQNLAFTGLNPCLNWESESRTERRVLSSEDKLIDEFQEDKGTPLPNIAVSVVSGEMSKNYITDKFGIFHLTLVGLNAKDSVFNMAREFDFRVGDDKRMTRRLLITREFAGKLLRAQSVIIQYEMAPTGKKLVDAVKKLEELKFNDLAYALEKRELAGYKNNSAFMKDFNDASLE